MLKKAKLEGERDIVEELGNQIKKMSLRVSAKDVIVDDAKDNALVTSKMYWMMGFNWGEIESILLDLDYPEKLVNQVVSETKEYATDLLKDGPFSSFRSGQLVKLTTGKVARLVNCSECVLTVCDQENGEFKVKSDKIDVSASLKLAKAHKLRTSAKEMMNVVSQTYKLPAGVPEGELPSKDIPDSTTFSDIPFSPAGLADLVPEKGDAKVLNKKLESAISTLEGIKKYQDELEEKVAGIRDKYLNPLNNEIKDVDIQKADAIKNVYLVLNQIGEGVKGNEVLFRDYNGKLVAFKNELKETEIPPSGDQELDALKEILKLNHPDIAGKAIAALDKWKASAQKMACGINSPVIK